MCVAHVFMNQARILENPEVPTYNVDRMKFDPAEGEEAHQCLQDALAHSNDTKGEIFRMFERQVLLANQIHSYM